MKKNKQEALYIHIPFCDSICDYCDFCKLQFFSSLADSYLKELKKEIESKKISTHLKTIYIGGGTPTSLNETQLTELLEFLEPFSSEAEEFTVECNPENLTFEKLETLKKHHVNRLSIGVQTTNNNLLKDIERKHTFEQVEKVLFEARKLGFNNISFDLIAGLPGATFDMFKEDLAKIVELNPDHLSVYSLTVHPHTVFGIKGIKEKDDDILREHYDYANDFLKKNGYENYEISNWAKNHKYSKHNLTYWKDEEYYGVGLSASGYVNACRYTNTRNLNKYLKGMHEDFSEKITLEDDVEYYLMLNLRTIFGVNKKDFFDRFNINFDEKYKNIISDLVNRKLALSNETCFMLSYEGRMILDNILLDFYK